jgi:cobalt-zinc-cadmium efflux system protein
MGAHAHSHGSSGHDHDHAHGHAHDHGHSHAAAASRSRLTIVLGLSATYLVAEVVGGYLTNSLALLADAGHMLSDVASLVLALVAMRVAQRPPTTQRTFGYQRAEILAALANGAALLAASVWIVVEAWQRLRAPAEVAGLPMLAIATGGLLVNLISMAVLHSGRNGGLNERGVWLHVATDALGSVGAMVAGVAVWRFGFTLADPIVSVAIAILVAVSSWRLLRETVDVLMESAPAHVDVAAVRRAMSDVPGVLRVHDLHVWSISSGTVALAGHVQVAVTMAREEQAALLSTLCATLRDEYGIGHVTIQMEPDGFDQAARCDTRVVSPHPKVAV